MQITYSTIKFRKCILDLSRILKRISSDDSLHNTNYDISFSNCNSTSPVNTKHDFKLKITKSIVKFKLTNMDVNVQLVDSMIDLYKSHSGKLQLNLIDHFFNLESTNAFIK